MRYYFAEPVDASEGAAGTEGHPGQDLLRQDYICPGIGLTGTTRSIIRICCDRIIFSRVKA